MSRQHGRWIVPEGTDVPMTGRYCDNLCTTCGVRVWSSEMALHDRWHEQIDRLFAAVGDVETETRELLKGTIERFFSSMTVDEADAPSWSQAQDLMEAIDAAGLTVIKTRRHVTTTEVHLPATAGAWIRVDG